MTHVLVALDEVSRVTDHELITRLRQLVRDDQVLRARLVVHLGEVDARGLYREQAYSSMFAYCVEELRMSEAQAYLRIQAARLGRQFPRILQLLAQGALHLTALKMLGPHLTADNHLDLLERACGKRKREVERLVAEIAPKPDVPNRMRKLPEPRTARSARAEAQVAPTSVEATQASTVATQTLNTQPEVCEPMRGQPSLESSTVMASRDGSDVPVESACEANGDLFALEAPRQRSSSTPLSPGRYKVVLTAGQALHDKLAQLQDLLRHQLPDGDLAVIVERAVDLLLDDTLKQRFAQTRESKKPRAAKRPAGDPSRGHAVATEAPSCETPRGGAAAACDPSQGNALAPEATAFENPTGGATAACDPSQGNALAPEAPCFENPTGGATAACDPSQGNALAPEAPCFETPTGGARRPRTSNSRYIPRAVVREVYQRDAGQCTFVSSEGKRCSERGFLELHHHDLPYARGGQATVENLRLVCRAHNLLFADRDFGRAVMRSKQKRAREPIDELGLGRVP